MANLDTEPALAKLLEERKSRRHQPAYIPKREADLTEQLQSFFATHEPQAQVSNVSRLGGGASKEQFIFSLSIDSQQARYVLRMDPLEAVTETDRAREFQALKLFQGKVPVPVPRWIDEDGSFFGRPAMMMEFVGGVTKPTSNQQLKVSGLGTVLGDGVRENLQDEFLQHLLTIHDTDWRNANLPNFANPESDSKQSARWQLNYWAELWRQDGYDEPLMTLAEQWMTENLPDADDLVFVHGDYRTGNYLFDEETLKMTAILDWELAYIGDYHDDLAWIIQSVFGTRIDGKFRVSDLFGREEFLSRYSEASGRPVNAKTLHYYEVFSAYKCVIITLGCGYKVSSCAHNHQDVLLSFLAGAGPMFKAQLCQLLREGQNS